MWPKHVLYIMAALISLPYCTSERQYFRRCNTNGFSCTTVETTRVHVNYNCPTGKTDVSLFLWEFAAPGNIRFLTISNCITLRLHFGCLLHTKPIRRLIVANIENLYILPSVITHNPPYIIFNNISNFVNIPTNTFSQIKSKIYNHRCFNPAADLQSLHFENVNIGIIEPKAFNALRDITNFIWKNVNVKRIQTNAIEIYSNNFNNITISSSFLEILEPLAIQLKTKEVKFLNNRFTELSPNAINGSFENFIFANNSVNKILPLGISILATNTFIKQNNFQHVSAKAFDNISPGLYQDCQPNFGKLRFLYEFSENSIQFIDGGALNPDIETYRNVPAELKFVKNAIECNCKNLGWLFVDAKLGYKTEKLKDFYEKVIDERNENYCMSTKCKLPIMEAYKLLTDGKCLQNIKPENLCSKHPEIRINSTSEEIQINSIFNKPQTNPILEEVDFYLNSSLHSIESEVPDIQNCKVGIPKIVNICNSDNCCHKYIEL